MPSGRTGEDAPARVLLAPRILKRRAPPCRESKFGADFPKDFRHPLDRLCIVLAATKQPVWKARGQVPTFAGQRVHRFWPVQRERDDAVADVSSSCKCSDTMGMSDKEHS